jgi:hypothetical protein
MKSVYKSLILLLGTFFLLFYCDDGEHFLGHAAGNLGAKIPSGSNIPPNNQGAIQVNVTAVYYEPTIKNIISNDCARCHSGVNRNLMDYDSLKIYADSGLLASMVQGPMRRFAGNDAQTIMTWAQNGAPEKSASVQAAALKNQNMIPAAAKAVFYEPTIKNIISNDCAQCHSGPSRNLMDYDSLKMYADTGLLATMVQGPMSQFAGNDAQTIVTWAQNGAPEKSPTVRVFFRSGGNCPPGQSQGAMGMQGQQGPITYNNGIRQVLAKDCLRCHSGPFRNLTTYDNVKVYVDNGLLKSLVSIGGPMHRFAGPDSHLIIEWIDNGAPQ